MKFINIFNEKYQQIPKLFKKIPYDDDDYIDISYAERNGQRKLFITELYFILKCYQTFKDNNFIIIYIGSAPGKHILSFL